MTTSEITAKLNAYCHEGRSSWRWCEEWGEFHDGNWIESDDLGVLSSKDALAIAIAYEQEANSKMTTTDEG